MTEFTKMQSCGNDYIYIIDLDERIKNEGKLSKILSERRFFIGADGLILLRKSDIADFKMEIFNADGSVGAMCGNGIRCAGRLLYEKKLTDKKKLKIETRSGIREVMLSNGGNVSVNIGKYRHIGRLFGENINISGIKFNVFLLSVGNPHAVLFTEKNIEHTDLKAVAEYVNLNIMNGVNVEIVNKLSDNRIKMRVYERGSGETLACGTGASAAVAALTEFKIISDKVVTVELVGGKLKVERRKDDTLLLSGKVKRVYDGYIDMGSRYEREAE